LHSGTQLQQSDSVPFLHERPQVRKSAAAQEYQAAKEAASGPERQKVLAGLFGLYPRPDDTKVIAANRNALAAAQGGSAPSSGSNGAWWAPSGSSKPWWQ
jgi:hypothetical protein